MSVQSGRPASDGQPADDSARPFTTGTGGLAAAGSGQAASGETVPPRPTFTARPSQTRPSETRAGETSAGPPPASAPDTGTGSGPAGAPDPGPHIPAPEAAAPEAAAPGAGPAAAGPATRGNEPTGPQPLPDTDGPLLGDAARLRARWQRVQADFVDDPQQAVGAAADLIEQTAQALIGSLRQRQRLLRVMWERGRTDASAAGTGDAAPAGGAAPGGGSGEAPVPAEAPADTEHLRMMMQRYRALFNQLCRP